MTTSGAMTVSGSRFAGNHRRLDDRCLDLVLAGSPGRATTAPAGAFEVRGFGDSTTASPAKLISIPADKAAMGAPVFLLDTGGPEALLVAGSAVRRLPRGAGGDDLLRRAAQGAAAWARERAQSYRRQLGANALVTFTRELAKADTEEQVYAKLVEHVCRVVSGYQAFLLRRDGDWGPLRPMDGFDAGYEIRELRVAMHPRYGRTGLITSADACADTGAPFAEFDRILCDTAAVWVAHAPVGDDAVLFLIERRAERTMEPDDWDLLRTVCEQAELTIGRIRLLNEVRSLALTDPLTGLANRRQLDAVMERAWGSARRGRALSAVLIDLDGFKEINDQHGHEAGDRILRSVAAELRTLVRESDLVVRYGGDEFLLLLPDTDAVGAVKLVRRVHDVLAGVAEFSIGIGEFHSMMAEPSELIAAADGDMYMRKQLRRTVLT